MSIRLMYKRCIHCHRTYTYNLSVCDFGAVCKHCRKIQIYLPSDKSIWKK